MLGPNEDRQHAPILVFIVHEISPPTPRRHPLLLPKLVFTASLGIPINLLHEAQGHIVTVELANGQVYRGKL